MGPLSAGCRKYAGVPVTARLAASLCAMCPLLPIPLTITRPGSPTASRRRRRTPLSSCAAEAARARRPPGRARAALLPGPRRDRASSAQDCSLQSRDLLWRSRWPTPIRPCCTICLVSLLAIALPCFAHAAVPPNVATFSVVAYDPALVKSAWQCRASSSRSVTSSSCKAGVGAVATQAFGQPEYGRMALDLMREGNNPTMRCWVYWGVLRVYPAVVLSAMKSEATSDWDWCQRYRCRLSGSSSSVAQSHDGSLAIQSTANTPLRQHALDFDNGGQATTLHWRRLP